MTTPITAEMIVVWRLVRRLDPAAAAVSMLALASAATVIARHDPALGRLLMRCGVSLLLFGYVHIKAHVEARDDHDFHLLIGAAAVPVGILALVLPRAAAVAVMALAVFIVWLELRDSQALYRGSRLTIGGRGIRLDFSFGVVIGLALLFAAPSAAGHTPGPLVTAAAGAAAAVGFAWLCARTSCAVDDPALSATTEANAAAERMLGSLDPALAARVQAAINADVEATPAAAPDLATSPGALATSSRAHAGPAPSGRDAIRSIPPPGWQG